MVGTIEGELLRWPKSVGVVIPGLHTYLFANVEQGESHGGWLINASAQLLNL